MKIDRHDLEKLNEMKSNKVDVENMIDGINTLNKQVQHVILILNEAIKLNVMKGEDTKLAKEHRSIYLLK